MPAIYIPTADDILPDTKMRSTEYVIAMLSVSGVILLITAVTMLVTILRKYWKKCRSLEESSMEKEVMVTFSCERNSRNGISPPDLSGQACISCICEVVDKNYRDTCEQ